MLGGSEGEVKHWLPRITFLDTMSCAWGNPLVLLPLTQIGFVHERIKPVVVLTV